MQVKAHGLKAIKFGKICVRALSVRRASIFTTHARCKKSTSALWRIALNSFDSPGVATVKCAKQSEYFGKLLDSSQSTHDLL
jgi:hypothetical protein